MQSYNMKRRDFIKGAATVTILGGASGCLSGSRGKAAGLADWREGYLDIHHIATGRGEVTFLMLPDGTTMLIDMGEVTGRRPEDQLAAPLPNGAHSTAFWVAQYIEAAMRPLNRKHAVLDQVLLTHFHNDHIGGHDREIPIKHGYGLSGITELAELVEIRKLVDRAWPDYTFPTRERVIASNPSFLEEYVLFAQYQRDKRKAQLEGFEPGRNDQFKLCHNPARYPGFEIRNVAANGKIWSGSGTATRTLFSAADKPDENRCSCSIKLNYGNFKYWSGGDTPGFNDKRDVESHVAPLVGRVDALILNHHGFRDSANALFLKTLRPRAMVYSGWALSHPHPETLPRLLDTSIYPEERHVYGTALCDDRQRGEKLHLGELAGKITTGHIVMRVYQGGDQYEIFVLDSSDPQRRIVSASGRLEAIGNRKG